jgi:hypothetical protein
VPLLEAGLAGCIDIAGFGIIEHRSYKTTVFCTYVTMNLN